MEWKANLEILATAGDLKSSALPWSLHCCSLTLSAAAFWRSCSKFCCPAKTENKQNLQHNPAPLVCKHTKSCAAARGKVSTRRAAPPCFWDMRLSWGGLWVRGLGLHRHQRSLFGPFSVSVLDKSLTDSRIFWPLRGTSEKHEPVCIYYCLHLFNILENLS